MTATATRLPPQVRKQARAAEEGVEALRKQREQPEPPPVETPPAQPEGVTQTPPPEQPAPQTPNEPTVEALKADLATERQRYKSLQGINQAQARELADVKERLRKLEEKPQPAATQDPERAKKHLTPEERETIGSATIDVQARIARSEVDPVNEKVADLEQRIQQQGHQYFLSTIRAQHREFDEINGVNAPYDSNPDWLLWLGVVDKKTGMMRQDLLTQAVKRQNVEQTWAFFEEFMRDTGYKPAEPPSVQVPKQPVAKPAPVAASPTPTAEPKKRTFAHSFVKKFFKDCSLGKFNGTKEERQQLENDIAVAEREGRIDFSR